MFFGQEGEPGIPLPGRSGCDEGQVIPPRQQLGLGRRPMSAMEVAPGPGVARGRPLRDDQDAADPGITAGSVVRRGLHGCDGEGLLVHHEVAAAEPMPGGRFTLERRVPLGTRRDIGAVHQRDRNENRQARESAHRQTPTHLGFRDHRRPPTSSPPTSSAFSSRSCPACNRTVTVFAPDRTRQGPVVMPRIRADTSFPAFHCMLTSRPPRAGVP